MIDDEHARPRFYSSSPSCSVASPYFLSSIGISGCSVGMKREQPPFGKQQIGLELLDPFAQPSASLALGVERRHRRYQRRPRRRGIDFVQNRSRRVTFFLAAYSSSEKFCCIAVFRSIIATLIFVNAWSSPFNWGAVELPRVVGKLKCSMASNAVLPESRLCVI